MRAPQTELALIAWDEPEGCTTPRGWAGLLNHPDAEWIERGIGHRCVGNWLDYTGTGEQGRDGKRIHAVAYICRVDHLGLQSTRNLGSSWHATANSARAWIERTVGEALR